jgi:exosortase/archaeosortase
MSSTARSKSVELAAILIGGIAVLASVYFLFLTEDNSYDITNKIISLAFLVFVVYNFLNMRGLKGEIENLTEQNATLMEKLTKTKGALKQTQADLETVKSDLVVAQTENEKRKAEVDTLKAALSAKED